MTIQQYVPYSISMAGNLGNRAYELLWDNDQSVEHSNLMKPAQPFLA